jgi:hypothetical protein
MISKEDRGKRYAQRDRVIRIARNLARSGRYPNVLALLPELELLDGFADARERFEDRALRAQLEWLCATAQDRSSVVIRRPKFQRTSPAEQPATPPTRGGWTEDVRHYSREWA